ncbi:MAG: CHASE2 domain-containing protein [Myxococcota bacterium]
MRHLLSKRRFELIALVSFLVFGGLHMATARPIVGLQTGGNVVHRLVQNFESRVATVFFLLRGEQPPHPDVVVLELDERGAQRYGLWPWPRDQIAKALDALLDADAKVIGLDVTFTDETQINQREKGWLEALAKEPALPESLQPLKAELAQRVQTSPDEALEQVFRKGGRRIVQGVIPIAPSDVASISPEQRALYAAAAKDVVITRVPGRVKNSFVEVKLDGFEAHSYAGLQMPLPRFAAAGTAFGHFGTVPDIDSTLRRTPIVAKVSEPPGLVPSLGLVAAAAALDAQIVPVIADDEIKGVELRGASRTVLVPMQNDAPYTLINYPGSNRVFQKLSFVDAVDGTFDRAKVAGKVVLAGVTIVGSSGDQRVTPFNEFEPGVYSHASMVSNILRGDFLDRPFWVYVLELALMFALGLVLAIVTPRIRFAWKMVMLVAVLLGFSALAYGAFTVGLKMNWVVPMAHLTVTAFATVFLGYLSVDREKLKMRSTFSRYLGEEVMDVALQDPDKLNRGEKREMTVLFSDIRGFTSLSEHMSPEKLADFINQYLSPMTQIVFDEKGTLDKYIGDAVMAFWNAPLDQPDHALRACRAAVHMLERLEELKAGWRQAGYPELEIGIGINTGQMVVGNMGSDVRVDYTVLGDSVNLGSRLEGTNKEYDTRIIISEWTRAAVKDGIVTRRLGAVRVKGKKVPVGIFELRGLGTPAAAAAKAIAAFEAALAAWVERRWDDAERSFREVLAIWPSDTPTRNYLAELQSFRVTPPPPDWDGVVSLKTK